MFGIDLLDASLLPALLVALVAGLLSFLSPCVLPIVPPYIAYMSGISLEGASPGSRRAALPAALFFVLGLSTVFLLLGFAASALGLLLLAYMQWLNIAAGLMVMAFGLHFLGILRLSFIERDLRLSGGQGGGSAFGAYLLGLSFAFGWTPCIGPQLGAILSLAASEADLARGTVLLGVYALGLGLPFLAVAAFLPQMMRPLAALRQSAGRIEKIMGLLLWTIGLLMLTGGFSALSYWLLETFPALAQLG